MTVLTSARSVSSSGAAEVTSTVVVVAPITSFRSILGAVSAYTVTLLATAVWKPFIVACTL